MQIGICDDNAEARLALRAALERALDRRRSEGVFLKFSSSAWRLPPLTVFFIIVQMSSVCPQWGRGVEASFFHLWVGPSLAAGL